MSPSPVAEPLSAVALVFVPDELKLWVGTCLGGTQPQNFCINARIDVDADDRHRHTDVEPVSNAIVCEEGGCLRLDRRAQCAEQQVSLERRVEVRGVRRTERTRRRTAVVVLADEREASRGGLERLPIKRVVVRSLERESKVELLESDRDAAFGKQRTEGRAGGYDLAAWAQAERKTTRRRGQRERRQLRCKRDIQLANGERQVFAAQEEVRRMVNVGRGVCRVWRRCVDRDFIKQALDQARQFLGARITGYERHQRCRKDERSCHPDWRSLPLISRRGWPVIMKRSCCGVPLSGNRANLRGRLN